MTHAHGVHLQGGRGETASASETSSDINQAISLGRSEITMNLLRASHIPETYEEYPTVDVQSLNLGRWPPQSPPVLLY